MSQVVGNLDDILEHAGVKGMRWGVRREEPRGGSRSKGSKSKLQSSKAVKKHGGRSIRQVILNQRKLEAKYDIDHIDPKTGEYTHQNKAAKVGRAVDRALDMAGVITVVAGTALAAGVGV